MNKLGLIVKIYMKNGFIFQGCINKYEDDLIILKTVNGSLIEISLVNEIIAIEYFKHNDKHLKEKNIQDETPAHPYGDIPSLVALKKMKAEEELKDIKSKLSSPVNSLEPITYESQLSSLIGIIKHK